MGCPSVFAIWTFHPIIPSFLLLYLLLKIIYPTAFRHRFISYRKFCRDNCLRVPLSSVSKKAVGFSR